MKYKVGDKVKILPRKDSQRNQSPFYLDKMTEFAGKTLTISGIPDSGITDYGSYILKGNSWFWHEDWLQKVDKLSEEKPIKYVLFYDENDHDPMVTFSELKEVKKWIKDNLINKDIDFDSIRIFEVKKELKFKKSINIQIK